MAEKKTVEIFDVKTKAKVKVPTDQCRLVTKETSRGPRTQVVGKIKDGDKEREIFMFVKKDFKL